MPWICVVVRRVAFGAASPAMWPCMDVPMGRLATVVAAMRRTVEPIHIHVCLCLHWDVCNACKLLQWSEQPHGRVFWSGMMPSLTWLRLCRWYMSCLSHRSTIRDAVHAMQVLCQCRRQGRSLWPTLLCRGSCRHVDICHWGYGHIETEMVGSEVRILWRCALLVVLYVKVNDNSSEVHQSMRLELFILNFCDIRLNLL